MTIQTGRTILDIIFATLAITNIILMLAIPKAGWITLFAISYVIFGTLFIMHRYGERIVKMTGDSEEEQ